MDEATAVQIYFDNLYNIANALINDDSPVNSAIADTNASGWGPEPADDPEITEVSENSFSFNSEIILTGDSHEDRGWLGDELTVQLSGSFKRVAGEWSLDNYDVLSVQNNFNQIVDD